MKMTTFTTILKAASETTKYAKRLSDETLAVMWMTTPQTTKEQVSDEMLAYAFNQLRIDPAPPEDLSVDQQLYSYVYRIRDGFPAFDWGLKPDLPERMVTGAFNPQPTSAYVLEEAAGIVAKDPEDCSNGVLRMLEGS